MTSTSYPGPFIIPNGPEKYSLSQMCRDEKVVTYVRCPSVQCGTRVSRSLLDSSVNAQSIRRQNAMQPRSSETFAAKEGDVRNENRYCENCNSRAKHEGIDWHSLIGSKINEYETRFEPVEEEYQRWTRDSSSETNYILGVFIFSAYLLIVENYNVH